MRACIESNRTTAVGGAAQWSREILPQSGGDLFQRPVDLIAGDNKRRGDANRVLMRVLGEDASGLQGLTVSTCTTCFRVKLDGQHQPASAHFPDRVAADAAQAIEKAGALGGCILDHPFLDQHAQRGPSHRTRQRITAEGRPVLARFQVPST